MDRFCQCLQKMGWAEGVSALTDADLKYLISQDSGRAAICNSVTIGSDEVSRKIDVAKTELMWRSNTKQNRVTCALIITNIILAIVTATTLVH